MTASPVRRRIETMLRGSVAVVLVALGSGAVDPIDTATADVAGAHPGSPRGAAAALTTGIGHICALLGDGNVKCWGYNGGGGLGLGDIDPRGDEPGEMGDQLPPIDLGTGRTATAVTAGNLDTCALLDDRTVKCWGRNAFGVLGHGDENDRGDGPGEMGDNLPVIDLGTGRTATAIANAGEFHACALLDDGAAKCWGANFNGQLGQGDTRDRGDDPGEMGDQLPAIDLGTGRTATAITTGYRHTCALLDNGTVKCWGANMLGALGRGDSNNRGDAPGEMGDELPVIDLGTEHIATAITAGYAHTCALLDNGTVKCWGNNFSGELGLGDYNNRGDAPGEMGDQLPAIDLGTGHTATAIAASYSHTCALLDDGTVKCWGENGFGQLGLGDWFLRGDGPGEMGDLLSVVDLGTGRTATAVTAGYVNTCALLDDGAVKCWGENSLGQLGIGDTDPRGDNAGEMGDSLAAVNLSGLVTPVVAAPATPAGVVATAGDSQAVVSWTAPGDDGGAPISGYRIQSSLDATNWTTISITAATSATISGLTNGSPVRFRVAAVNSAGTSPPSTPSAPVTPVTPVTPAVPPVFSVIDPVRVLDTRDGLGVGTQAATPAPVPGGSSIAVAVTALPQIPDTAAAVVVNVTTTRSAEAGFLTVHPCHQPVPEASNLNYRPGFDTATLTIAPISTDGKICIYTSATTDLIADITAYTTTSYHPETPSRLADTRHTTPNRLAPPSTSPSPTASTTPPTRSLSPPPAPPNPATSPPTTAADPNPTPASSTTRPESTPPTSPSSPAPSSASTPPPPSTSSSTTTAPSPARPTPPNASSTPAPAHHSPPVKPSPIPTTTGGTTRAINITATQQTEPGFFTLHPCNTTPTTSNLNYAPGRDIANLAIIPTTTPTCITTSATTHLIIDQAATTN